MSSAPEKELLNLDEVKVDPAFALRVPASLAVRRQMLPFALVNGQVCVACANDRDAATVQALQRHFPQPLRLFPAETTSLRRALDRIYSGVEAANRSAAAAAENTDTDNAVASCDELLSAAVLRQASDVHIDPGQDKLLIRFRVDGVLEEYRPFSMTAHPGIVSRLKVLGGLDIAERRASQDGHFSHATGKDRRIDIRVATLPTRYGERVTLRLLDSQAGAMSLESLGMLPDDLKLFASAIERPHGLILITGPTGSGKTTTLYAVMQRLIAQQSLNVITIEDPIEYEIPGVAQVEVDSADKVSFAKALRSVLRHDPDVVMIGEIRDSETADVAIKSALTGHLVLSTMHTNSAASAVTRMADMGVDRFLIAATLRLAAAQRLVRRLCKHCRQPRPLTEAEAEVLHRPEMAGKTVYDASGCHYCANRGYVGRLGVFEIIVMNEAVSKTIAGGVEEMDILEAAKKYGARQLHDDGLAKLLAGDTSPEELLTAVTVW